MRSDSCDFLVVFSGAHSWFTLSSENFAESRKSPQSEKFTDIAYTKRMKALLAIVRRCQNIQSLLQSAATGFA